MQALVLVLIPMFNFKGFVSLFVVALYLVSVSLLSTCMLLPVCPVARLFAKHS